MNYLDEIISEMTERRILENIPYNNGLDKGKYKNIATELGTSNSNEETSAYESLAHGLITLKTKGIRDEEIISKIRRFLTTISDDRTMG
jgi:hypothetical protein